MYHNHTNSKQAGNCADSGFPSSHLSSLEGKEFKGVEAQTLANVYLALENNLKIVHALSQSPKQVLREIEEVIGLDCSNAIFCSAKDTSAS
ncbi:hypothetical protein YC2023_085729 [Brassica napus]